MFPLQQDNLWTFVSLFTKCELHLTTKYKIIHEYTCCDGNKVFLATRSFMDFYCPNEQM